MRWAAYFVDGVLLVAAVYHLLPVAGVLGPERLARLYGVRIDDPALLVLMRHRAVLFALLGAFMIYAVFVARMQSGNGHSPPPIPGLHPGYETLALFGGLVSTGSFVLLARTSTLTPLLQRVLWIDIGLFALLACGLAARLLILR